MKKGVFFVIVQFACILFMLPATVQFSLSFELFIQVLAIILGVWAIYEAKKSRLSIFPELKKDASLIRSGPYHLIRHPMYTAILLFFLPSLWMQWSWDLFSVYLILSVNLIFKLKYEEQILLKEFDDYIEYKEKSYHLIPYFY